MALSIEEIEKRIHDSYELPNRVLDTMPEPMVTVRTSTYQHAPYIKQCIEGVLMQKTTFPFEFIIGEDFSTDGTRETVFEYAKKYPDIIRVITADYNVGSKANGRRCAKASRGKYMALCEGDDYWTDPLKLQKQVDFLETHSDYGLVYSKVKCFVQKRGKFISIFGGKKEKFEELLLGNTIPTLTACFRKELLNRYRQEIEPERQNWLMGDYPTWLYFAHTSRIKFEDASTGVYRILEESASRSKNVTKMLAFYQSSFDLCKYFADRYCDRSNPIHQSLKIASAWSLFRYWTQCNLPHIKRQVNDMIVNVQEIKSLKVKLIKITLSFPVIRYLFVFYDKCKYL